MSGTSAGKTTKVPLMLAADHGANVLVLMPSVAGVAHVARYVSSVSGETRVDILRNEHLKENQAVKGRVWFSALGEFLAMFCSNADLMKILRVDCIIVDESHEIRPEYEVMKYLVAAGKFSEVKVFYSSATAATDISLEANPNRAVRVLPASQFPSQPSALTPKCPAHHSMIADKTLMFLPSDYDFPLWEEYYTGNDIPVFKAGYDSASNVEADIRAFLDGTPVGVVLATPLFQTTFTFDVGTVIVPGRTVTVETDFESGRVSLTRRPSSKSDMTQQTGRVGRVRPGVAYVSDVKAGQAVTAQDVDVSVYTYIWLKLFGIVVMSDVVARFEPLLGTLSHAVYADILTSAIPVMGLLPYYSDSGVYKGWTRGLKTFNSLQTVHESAVSNEDKLNGWPTLYYRRPGANEDHVYKSLIQFPSEWSVVVFHLWDSKEEGYFDEAGSVVGSVYDPTSSRRSIAAKPVKRSSSPRVQRSMTVKTVSPRDSHIVFDKRKAPMTPVVESPDKMKSLRDLHIADAIPPLPSATSHVVAGLVKERQDSEVAYAEEVDKKTAVAEWVGKTRRSTSSSTGSSSSKYSYRKVTATEHAHDLMYPMDAGIRQVYLENTALSALDKQRCKQLLKGTRYSTLASDPVSLERKQKEYFLAVLRTHKATHTDLLQHYALAPKGIAKFFTRDDLEVRLEAKLRDLALLLDTCASVGYTVGIKTKKKHSSTVTIGLSEIERREDLAAAALELGTVECGELVSGLKECAVPIVQAEQVVGNGWLLNGELFTAVHVLEAVSNEECEDWCGYGHEFFSRLGEVAVGDATEFTDHDNRIEVRKPVAGEYVSVLSVLDTSNVVSLLGFHEIKPFCDAYIFEGDYLPGMSGSLVVAHSPPAVVGMYMGSAGRVGSTKFSTVVPLI
jgi:hypothetical protein